MWRSIGASTVIAMIGCGGGGGGTAIDAATDGLGVDVPAGGPIVAPDDLWTWVPIDGMQCGNGSATGVGVNLTDRSDRVVVFLNGGGACWDANTCFTLHTAAGIDADFGEPEFQALVGSLASYPMFQRIPANPFRDASFVFVPYCTGDLHAGHHVADYGAGTVHHVGQDNLDALWPRLHATRPSADVVWFAGASAGGYGVMLEQARARAALPSVRIHALSDSSHPVDPEPVRWAAMQPAWALDLPAGCAACANGFAGWPGHLRATMPAGSRWGLLMETRDMTIGQYMGYSGPQLESQTIAIRDGMAAGTGQAAFVVAGMAHVLTVQSPAPMTASGVLLGDWIRDFASGAAGWQSVGP